MATYTAPKMSIKGLSDHQGGSQATLTKFKYPNFPSPKFAAYFEFVKMSKLLFLLGLILAFGFLMVSASSESSGASSSKGVASPARVRMFRARDVYGDDEDRWMQKRQLDDYGHMRFGKRADFEDYGHMRFGR